MKFDKNLISRLEGLTMLKLSEEEKEKLVPELDKIVKMMDKLKEIDVDDMEPLHHLSPGYQSLRKDIESEMLKTEEAMKNAAKSEGNYFMVPKVIKT